MVVWAVLAAGLDLGSKWAASVLHAHGTLPGLIVRTENPAFSMGVASASRPVMILLSLGFLLAFGGWCVHLALAGRLAAWIPGLLIGGGLANLADRVVFGAVHDWLRIGPINYNIADFLVLAGVIGWVLVLTVRRARQVADPPVRGPSSGVDA